MMDKVDDDKSGELEFVEFVKMMAISNQESEAVSASLKADEDYQAPHRRLERLLGTPPTSEERMAKLDEITAILLNEIENEMFTAMPREVLEDVALRMSLEMFPPGSQVSHPIATPLPTLTSPLSGLQARSARAALHNCAGRLPRHMVPGGSHAGTFAEWSLVLWELVHSAPKSEGPPTSPR